MLNDLRSDTRLGAVYYGIAGYIGRNAYYAYSRYLSYNADGPCYLSGEKKNRVRLDGVITILLYAPVIVVPRRNNVNDGMYFLALFRDGRARVCVCVSERSRIEHDEENESDVRVTDDVHTILCGDVHAPFIRNATVFLFSAFRNLTAATWPRPVVRATRRFRPLPSSRRRRSST